MLAQGKCVLARERRRPCATTTPAPPAAKVWPYGRPQRRATGVSGRCAAAQRWDDGWPVATTFRSSVSATPAANPALPMRGRSKILHHSRFPAVADRHRSLHRQQREAEVVRHLTTARPHASPHGLPVRPPRRPDSRGAARAKQRADVPPQEHERAAPWRRRPHAPDRPVRAHRPRHPCARAAAGAVPGMPATRPNCWCPQHAPGPSGTCRRAPDSYGDGPGTSASHRR